MEHAACSAHAAYKQFTAPNARVTRPSGISCTVHLQQRTPAGIQHTTHARARERAKEHCAMRRTPTTTRKLPEGSEAMRRTQTADAMPRGLSETTCRAGVDNTHRAAWNVPRPGPHPPSTATQRPADVLVRTRACGQGYTAQSDRRPAPSSAAPPSASPPSRALVAHDDHRRGGEHVMDPQCNTADDERLADGRDSCVSWTQLHASRDAGVCNGVVSLIRGNRGSQRSRLEAELSIG